MERFIQTLQQEVLDHFIVFGQQHMDHIVFEALTYYHEERPHQAKGNHPLAPSAPAAAERHPQRLGRAPKAPLSAVWVVEACQPHQAYGTMTVRLVENRFPLHTAFFTNQQDLRSGGVNPAGLFLRGLPCLTLERYSG